MIKRSSVSGDRGETGILVWGLEQISRDCVMPLPPKSVAVLAINSSVSCLEYYPHVILSSRHVLSHIIC